MKVVLFCGGLGMRMREVSGDLPKPLVPIGERPILWHLMTYYAAFGHRDFVLCLGHGGEAIRRYFQEYDVESQASDGHDWRITFVDTGDTASVGERLAAVRPYLDSEEMFLANYSDVLTDLHLPALVERVQRSDAVGGFLAARPPYSFHVVDVDRSGSALAFREIAETDLRINGGYFVWRREVFDHLATGEDLPALLSRLAASGRLAAIKHDGFWMPMDTPKEREHLDALYRAGQRPWLPSHHVAPMAAAPMREAPRRTQARPRPTTPTPATGRP